MKNIEEKMKKLKIPILTALEEMVVRGNTDDIATIEWKCKLADAILEEAEFNETSINMGDKIEHQLGTVWIGDATIGIEKSYLTKCNNCGKEITEYEIKFKTNSTNWKCPKCNKRKLIMEPNLEKIKKMCYRNGAIDAIDNMVKELKKRDNYIYLEHSIKEIYRQLMSKYRFENLISGDELNEAQQKK